ncbi:MAG: NAD(P)H-dependent oxidoreductase [Rhizobiaceae bacterium]|nr:NAD(P)H-dependent oxidoreductase [Rhizobiaceae bacterium]
MSQPKVIAVSAGAAVPSRTTALVQAATAAVTQAVDGQAELIELSEVAPLILTAASRADLGAAGEALVKRIEAADILVVGSPVYRASYTGLFKHLFDLVDHRALAGRLVLLTATGGSLEHSLVIEHQFRPLFGFFGAVTLPTGLYAQPSDIVDGAIVSSALQERVGRAASEASTLFTGLARRQPPANA